MKKGLERYSANLGINVGELAHLSLLAVITCGNIYNECNYARPRSLCGAVRVVSRQQSKVRCIKISDTKAVECVNKCQVDVRK